MKKLAQFEKFNPFRRPDWRYQRALRLAQQAPMPGRCSSRDDAWIRGARDFLVVWPKADESMRERMLWNNPGLAYAYRIYERRGTAPRPALALEARLLAGQTFEYIANELSILPDTARWYEALFFNVLEYLHQRDWITDTVLIPPILQHMGGFGPSWEEPPEEGDETPAARRRRLNMIIPVALPFQDATLKYFAYFGGPVVADIMLHGIVSGRQLASADELPRWYDETLSSILKRRSVQSAACVEINKFSVMDLFNVHVRIMELERGDDAQENRRSTVERHVRALLDDLPWRVGPRPKAEDPLLLPYRGLPGELRDDEILVGAKVPVEELQMALPPPRPQQPHPPTTDDQSNFT